MMAAHGAVVRGRLGRKGEDMLFLLLIKKFWVQRNIIAKLGRNGLENGSCEKKGVIQGSEMPC